MILNVRIEQDLILFAMVFIVLSLSISETLAADMALKSDERLNHADKYSKLSDLFSQLFEPLPPVVVSGWPPSPICKVPTAVEAGQALANTCRKYRF